MSCYEIVLIGRGLRGLGDYNTEALIFKMVTARFLIFFGEKKKENAFSLLIT